MECVHILINLLKDAYATEESIIDLLENHSENTDDIELKARLEEKIESINDQAAKIKERVEKLDDEVSSTRAGLASVILGMEDFPLGFEKGKAIRDAIIEYGVDFLEQAMFKAILTAARECRDERTIDLCQELIGDERENAEAADQILSGAVLDYINREVVEKTDIDYTGEDEMF